MRSRSPLWNLVFITFLILAFIWVKYAKEKGSRVLLGEFVITSPSEHPLGKVSIFSQGQERIIRIKLKEMLEEEVYVILYREGIGTTLGKISGTVFVRSLGPSFALEEGSSVILRGVKSGLVYGEAVINLSSQE